MLMKMMMMAFKRKRDENQTEKSRRKPTELPFGSEPEAKHKTHCVPESESLSPVKESFLQ